MKKIYKIEFDHSSYELDKFYGRLSEQDKASISSMNPDAFFDFNYRKGYVLYLILSPLEIEKYSSIMDSNLIAHEISDISDDILENKVCQERDLAPFVNPMNRTRWESYRKTLDEWIYERLDIDFVLDRIGECGGIDNLRPVEKKFLKNYQN